MGLAYVQSDTATAIMGGCSGVAGGVSQNGRQLNVSGAPGSGSLTVDPGNNVTRWCLAFTAGSAPNLASWAAGNYVVRVNHTVMDAGTRLSAVYICDVVNSGTQAVVASNTSTGHIAGATGVLTVTVNRATAYTPQIQAQSKLHVVLVYTNTDTHGTSSGTVMPDQTIDTPIGDSTSPSLTVQNAAHGQAAGSPALVQANTLAVANASHAHSAGAPTLQIPAVSLTVADAAHAHAADSAELVQASTLTVASAAHGQAADSVALTEANVLAVEGTAHAQAADNAVLSVAVTLDPEDASHAHAAEAPALSVASTLAPDNAIQAHAAEDVALVQASLLTVADAAHAQAAESPGLLQASTLAVAAASHAHAADNVTVSAAAALEVSDAAHALSSGEPALIQASSLAVESAAHSHAASNLTLSVAGTLGVEDAAHTQAADAPSLVQASSLAVEGAAHTHAADTVALSQAAQLQPADAGHGQAADGVSLAQENTLDADDALHTHLSEAPSLVQSSVLGASNAEHSQAGTSPTLSLSSVLDVALALHDQEAGVPSLVQAALLIVANSTHNHLATGVVLQQAGTIAVASASHGHTAAHVILLVATDSGLVIDLEALADLVARIRETAGVPVTIDGVDTWGHFDILQEEHLEDTGPGVIVNVPALTFATGSAPAPSIGDELVIDGSTWIARDVRRLPIDGGLTLVLLADAGASAFPALDAAMVSMLEEQFRLTGGVPVSAGGADTWGHLDESDAELLTDTGRGVIAAGLRLTIASGALPPLGEGDQLVVDGELREVLSAQRLGADGGLTAIALT